MNEQAVLALVGGGRWARVYLSVLAAMPLPWPLAVVARHGGGQMEGTRDGAGRAVTVVPDLDALLARGPVAGAIVVNAAAAHVPTTLRLLQAGVPVLVEKPAATDAAAAARLVQVAAEQGVALLPALTYLHCAYLDNFARMLRERGTRPSVLRLDWADPASEARYGEQKQYDRGIGLAMDVVPHVWAIVAGVLGERAPRLEDCGIERGGRRVTLRLRAGEVDCEVLLEREAAQRRRLLAVDGGLAIDFSQEPGTITADGRACSGDPGWATRADRPVRRQVEAFLAALGKPPAARALADFEASTGLAAACDARVKDQQARLLAATSTGHFDGDVACALNELLSQRLLAAGTLAPGDRASLDGHVAALRDAMARQGGGDWLQALTRRPG